MLEHGGDVMAAARHYAIAADQWLDLSTGINPNGWPVPQELPSEIWSQLPQRHDELTLAAQLYYECDSLLATAGSQAAIQTLPLLRSKSRVGVLFPCYAEHAHAWKAAGHDVIELQPSDIDQHITSLDVLIIVNPNNPSGQHFSSQQLLDWHSILIKSGGWLIIDEAFIDSQAEHSLAKSCPQSGLLVLRSLGKFFGLAGLRVGFILAEPALLQILEQRLGPWPIAHSSRYLATQALQDSTWQQHACSDLKQKGQRLAQLLLDSGLKPTGGCHLFQWIKIPQAEQFHQILCHQAILTRLFKQPNSLRLGLPKTEQDWQRLHDALGELTRLEFQ